jgi:hypothetical protein
LRRISRGAAALYEKGGTYLWVIPDKAMVTYQMLRGNLNPVAQ